MATIDRGTGPGGDPIADPSGPIATAKVSGASGSAVGHRRPAWRMALAVGIAAGLIAWIAGEMVHGAFALPEGLRVSSDPSTSPLKAREQSIVNRKNATLTFGLMGAVLGMALGGAGGLARRAPRAAMAAGAVGLVMGAAVGSGLSWVVVPLADRYSDRLADDLMFAILLHGGIWAAIGAAAGLAFGLGAGGGTLVPRAGLGGIVGAALGTAVYDLVGALAFPLDSTSSPLSTTATTRLLARLAIAIPVALGAAWAVGAPPGEPAPANGRDGASTPGAGR